MRTLTSVVYAVNRNDKKKKYNVEKKNVLRYFNFNLALNFQGHLV